MSAFKIPAALFTCVLVAAPFANAQAKPLRIAGHLTFPAIAGRARAQRSMPHRAYATSSQIGSGGDVTADALVARPNEAPCVDTLFSNAQFSQYAPQTFAYAPPPGCPGPYAKIVFNGDFAVSAGVQFDRTASIEIGNVPIFFGTTAEPSGLNGPTWHVERDLTDDAALLATAQTGEADIFNIVNSTYTGVISGTTYVQFYPATSAFAPRTTPDLVLPVPGVPGGPQSLSTGASTLSATYKFPKNVTQAYLDVYSQGQQSDEFYYTCAPSDVAAELDDCGNGPFRETEVSIDGIPAGAAPVTPWIFTGGIDPFLWTPIPGVQTLEFRPYRVDLTPFAGLLSMGKTKHTITLSVDNADQYFSEIATLFVYRDPGATKVTGALTANTLVPNPAATVVENLTGTSPDVDGTITVSNARNYEIDGYVNTSKGLVQTSVVSQLDFSNMQTYSDETPVSGSDKIVQTTTDKTTSTSVGPNGTSTVTNYVSFPLTINITSATAAELISIDQENIEAVSRSGPASSFTSYTTDEVTPTDTYTLATGAATGNSAQKSSQTYAVMDSAGVCYQQTLQAVSNTLLSVSTPACTSTDARRRLQTLRTGLLQPLRSRFLRR